MGTHIVCIPTLEHGNENKMHHDVSYSKEPGKNGFAEPKIHYQDI